MAIIDTTYRSLVLLQGKFLVRSRLIASDLVFPRQTKDSEYDSEISSFRKEQSFLTPSHWQQRILTPPNRCSYSTDTMGRHIARVGFAGHA